MYGGLLRSGACSTLDVARGFIEDGKELQLSSLKKLIRAKKYDVLIGFSKAVKTALQTVVGLAVAEPPYFMGVVAVNALEDYGYSYTSRLWRDLQRTPGKDFSHTRFVLTGHDRSDEKQARAHLFWKEKLAKVNAKVLLYQSRGQRSHIPFPDDHGFQYSLFAPQDGGYDFSFSGGGARTSVHRRPGTNAYIAPLVHWAAGARKEGKGGERLGPESDPLGPESEDGGAGTIRRLLEEIAADNDHVWLQASEKILHARTLTSDGPPLVVPSFVGAGAASPCPSESDPPPGGRTDVSFAAVSNREMEALRGALEVRKSFSLGFRPGRFQLDQKE